MRHLLFSIRRLTLADGAVLVQAAILLPIAASAIRVCRLERAIRLVAAVPLPLTGVAPPPAPRLARLVSAATMRLGAACLTRALVLQTLLTRRGAPAVVVIGASRDDRLIRAHAWVEHNGVIVSADGAQGFAPLCRVDARGTTTRAAIA